MLLFLIQWNQIEKDIDWEVEASLLFLSVDCYITRVIFVEKNPDSNDNIYVYNTDEIIMKHNFEWKYSETTWLCMKKVTNTMYLLTAKFKQLISFYRSVFNNI